MTYGKRLRQRLEALRINFRDTPGEKIVAIANACCETAYILFESGKFCIMEVNEGYYNESPIFSDPIVKLDYHLHYLVELGVATEVEESLYLKEKEEIRDEHRANFEMNEYRRLKRKFDKGEL